MNCVIWFWLLVAVHGATVQAENSSCVTVKTEAGLVCGATKMDVDGKTFVGFMGVPYAKAPVKELRYAEPQERDPFDGVFNATAPGPICPQTTDPVTGAFMIYRNMSEDCLRMNIYVPSTAIPDPGATESKPLLPILVYIHGGLFTAGAGNPDIYGPEFLVTQDIIVCFVDYRLNSFGFLSLGSEGIPGNAGLKDVIFALKWIQKNIKNFGGDPTQVTLGGVSGGSVMAHLVAISPAVKDQGLIKRVLLTSGYVLSTFLTPSPTIAKRLSTAFLQGLKINPLLPPEEIRQKLIEIPVEKILEANKFATFMTQAEFGPVIDKEQKGVTAVLPKTPLELLQEGYGNELNTLFSFTSDEEIVFSKVVQQNILLIAIAPMFTLPKDIQAYGNRSMLPTLMKMMSSEYFNNLPPKADDYVRALTDSIYKYPALRVIELRTKSKAAPSYLYQFSFKFPEENPLQTKLGVKWDGVAHSEDISYFFRLNSALPPVEKGELNQDNAVAQMRKSMTSFIANFVKYGHPGKTPNEWSSCGKQYKMMNITNAHPKLQSADEYLLKKKSFYDKLYRMAQVKMT